MIFENVYITNQDFATKTRSEAQTTIRMNGIANNPVDITFSNFTIENAYSSGSLNAIQLILPDNYSLTMKDVTFRNFESDVVVILVTGMSQKYLENIKFINCTMIDTQILNIADSDSLTVANISFENMTMPDSLSTDLVEFVRVLR